MDDDLDNLIADSISGVETALEGERKASASTAGAAASGAGASEGWAKEAVRELQQGPAEADAAPGVDEDMLKSMMQAFQDENFQKVFAEALNGADPAALAAATDGSKAAAPAALPATPAALAAPLAPASSSKVASATSAAAPSTAATSAAAPDAGAEEFLAKFMKSFDSAVGGDQNFEQSMGSLMSSMLSSDIICEPLQQISSKLEPWLKEKKGLPQSERSRCEGMLSLQKRILHIYKSSPDPLPEDARGEVQRLMTELHGLGQPPDEVMEQLAPQGGPDDGQGFEDFMKSMGLDGNLGAAEQDLLKKMSEDPEELTKMMKGMAEGMPEEACKQQ